MDVVEVCGGNERSISWLSFALSLCFTVYIGLVTVVSTVVILNPKAVRSTVKAT